MFFRDNIDIDLDIENEILDNIDIDIEPQFDIVPPLPESHVQVSCYTLMDSYLVSF